MIDKRIIDDIARQFDELIKTQDVMKDGILCFEKYNNAKPRIMWVLKQNIQYEYNDYAIQLTQNMDRIASSPTWRRLAYVSHGIISGDRNFGNVKEVGTEKFGESLLATAIIEANKDLGDASSPDHVILAGFEKYRDLIFEQITAYNPDVIIVAMVGQNECLKPIVEEIYKHFTREDEYSICGHTQSNGADVAWSCIGDKVFLWAYHPSYIKDISDKDYFDTLVNAYDTAKK